MVDQGVMWCFRTFVLHGGLSGFILFIVGTFCHWAAFGWSGVMVCATLLLAGVPHCLPGHWRV